LQAFWSEISRAVSQLLIFLFHLLSIDTTLRISHQAAFLFPSQILKGGESTMSYLDSTRIRFSTSLLVALFLLCTSGAALGQSISGESAATAVSDNSPTVTASSIGSGLRFTAPNSVSKLRLEVYTDAGQKVFDSKWRAGNLLDWAVQGSSGAQLLDGSYMIVVSANSVSGQASQRTGALQLSAGVVTLKSLASAELNSTQRQSLTSADATASISILQPGEINAAATVAHNGTDAQVSRTRGALTFRLGDFFSGTDREQMTLTEEGRLGIGTSTPQATLDVAGDVRASGTISAQKIEFPDGTVQTTAVKENANAGGNTNNITGTGTQNQVAKWIDNADQLGNSAITEVGGNVGITNTNPSYRLSVGPNYGPGLAFAAMTVSKGAGQSVSALIGPSFGLGAEVGWDNTGTRGFVNVVGGPLAFMNNFSEKMRIQPNGFVGVGTNAPAFNLDVAGVINGTQYNLGGVKFLSAPGNNTFVGVNSGQANTGTNNSFFGNNAGASNTTGSFNTFSGTSAGLLNTTGEDNSFFGANAGLNNTSGRQNTFIGALAGQGNSTGIQNAFFGTFAGQTNTASFNSFFGAGAGASNIAGTQNAFFGYVAGLNNIASFNSFFGAGAGTGNMIGNNNAFFGNSAGVANTSGSSNTFVGNDAGSNNTTGSSNIAIGDSAGDNLTTGNNNIDIGNSGIAGESDTIRIGSTGTHLFTYVSGIFGSPVAGGAPVFVDPTGKLGTVPSARRYKQDIHNMGSSSSRLMQLRPVTYLYRPEMVPGADRTLQYGLIAEEVEKVYPEMVQHTADGQVLTVRYNMLNTMLLNEVQKQQQVIHTQTQQINELEQRLRRLEAAVTARPRAKRRSTTNRIRPLQ
jgi:hypothetical protein